MKDLYYYANNVSGNKEKPSTQPSLDTFFDGDSSFSPIFGFIENIETGAIIACFNVEKYLECRESDFCKEQYYNLINPAYTSLVRSYDSILAELIRQNHSIGRMMRYHHCKLEFDIRKSNSHKYLRVIRITRTIQENNLAPYPYVLHIHYVVEENYDMKLKLFHKIQIFNPLGERQPDAEQLLHKKALEIIEPLNALFTQKQLQVCKAFLELEAKKDVAKIMGITRDGVSYHCTHMQIRCKKHFLDWYGNARDLVLYLHDLGLLRL